MDEHPVAYYTPSGDLSKQIDVYQRIKKIKLTRTAVLIKVGAIVAQISNIMNNQTPGCCCMCTNMRMACRYVMRSP